MLSFLKNYMVFTILPEKMKIEKLVENLHNKKEFVIPIRNLKNSLNHWLVFKKVHRVIKWNKEAW